VGINHRHQLLTARNSLGPPIYSTKKSHGPLQSKRGASFRMEPASTKPKSHTTTVQMIEVFSRPVKELLLALGTNLSARAPSAMLSGTIASVWPGHPPPKTSTRTQMKPRVSRVEVMFLIRAKLASS